jgi:hypothetical protein
LKSDVKGQFELAHHSVRNQTMTLSFEVWTLLVVVQETIAPDVPRMSCNLRQLVIIVNKLMIETLQLAAI